VRPSACVARNENIKHPSGDVHAFPPRPRPETWRSATTTVPVGKRDPRGKACVCCLLSVFDPCTMFVWSMLCVDASVAAVYSTRPNRAARAASKNATGSKALASASSLEARALEPATSRISGVASSEASHGAPPSRSRPSVSALVHTRTTRAGSLEGSRAATSSDVAAIPAARKPTRSGPRWTARGGPRALLPTRAASRERRVEGEPCAAVRATGHLHDAPRIEGLRDLRVLSPPGCGSTAVIFVAARPLSGVARTHPRSRRRASRVSYEGTSKTHYRTEYVATCMFHSYVSAYLWSTIERRRTSRFHSGCAKRTG
jgi:hypothetical protein